MIVGIPVKVNADSSGKPNGVLVKANSRRSEATRVPESVRLRQRQSEGTGFPERSGGASAGIWGAGGRGGLECTLGVRQRLKGVVAVR